jgi:uncharacterized RDD family membrane protein YckC
MTSEIAGWYWAEGDPEGTKRYWNGETWKQGLVGAEPWRRISAKLIDVAIMITVSVLLALIFGTGRDTYLLTVLTLIIAVIYEVGFVATRGGTPGKLLMGFRVVEIATGETPPSGSVAALRWAPSLIGVVPFLGPLASIAILFLCVYWIFTDTNRQSVYDRVAKTYVVMLPGIETIK